MFGKSNHFIQPAPTLFWNFLHNFREIFGLDLRSLALFRVFIALTIVGDVFNRWADIRAHYSDLGVMPRHLVLSHFSNDQWITLHMMGGTIFFQQLLFLFQVAIAITMGVGFYTRSSTILSWFLLISLHNRNTLVLHGGDVYLRVLMFFACFLPLGRCYSIDNAFWYSHPISSSRRRHKKANYLHISVAAFAIGVQMCCVYVTSFMHKTGREWTDERTSTWLALQLDFFRTGIGDFLLQFPETLKILTAAVLWWEGYGVVFWYMPIFFGPLRTFGTIGFVGMHLGFVFALRLGQFGCVGTYGVQAMLPGWFWERIVFTRLRTKERLAFRLRFHSESSLATRIVIVLTNFFLIPETDLQPIYSLNPPSNTHFEFSPYQSDHHQYNSQEKQYSSEDEEENETKDSDSSNTHNNKTSNYHQYFHHSNNNSISSINSSNSSNNSDISGSGKQLYHHPYRQSVESSNDEEPMISYSPMNPLGNAARNTEMEASTVIDIISDRISSETNRTALSDDSFSPIASMDHSRDSLKFPFSCTYFLAEDFEGTQYRDFDALIACCRVSPLLWPLWYLFRGRDSVSRRGNELLRLTSSIFEFFGERNGSERDVISSTKSFSMISERKYILKQWYRITSSLFANLFALLFLLLILSWNTGNVGFNDYSTPSDFKSIAWLLHLDQSWSMFSPRPPNVQWYYIIQSELDNGTVGELFREEGLFRWELNPMSWSRPDPVWRSFKNHRWFKYYENGINTHSQNELLRLNFGRYLCREYNSRHRSEDHLYKLNMYWE